MPDRAAMPPELTACPRCDKAPLAVRDDGFRCSACKVDFPAVAGIPWLFADPASSLGEWRNRLQFSLKQLAYESQRMQSALDDELLDATRRRLERQHEANEAHRAKVRELLAPLDLQSMQGSYESYIAMRTRLPADQGIQTYYANVHRDWAWGDEENQASLDQLRKALGDASAGRTLVLGAGACRLAYDIHMNLEPELTVALDFNPMLLLVADAVTRGDSLSMVEFPLAPRTLEDFAVERTLAAPGPVRDDFHLVCGDVLRPPFAAGSFDTVVTPWIIDIVNDPLPAQAARINGLLSAGGRWLNFGSLAFDHPDRARRYSAEEVLDIVAGAGFDTPSTHETEIPYMCSPASRHARREAVFTFAAAKQTDVKPPPRHKALPDWIVTGKEPVPLLQSFRSQALSTQIHSYVMTLIDGKRTIADMAAVLEQQKLMSHQEAEPAIRNFLTRMYDDSQRNSGF